MSPSGTIRPGVQNSVDESVDTRYDPGVAPDLQDEAFYPSVDEGSRAGASFRWSPAAEYRYNGPVAAVTFSLDPANIVRLLGAVVIPVFCLGFLVAIVALFAGLDAFPTGTGDVWALLSLGRSANVASWFACLCFFASATAMGLLGSIATVSDDPLARDWRRLSWVFLLVSVDQVCTVHETVLSAIHRVIPFPRVFDFFWVVLVAAGLLYYFRRFLACLPPPIRNRFALSAVIYFFGALGMEFGGIAIPTNNGVHGLWEFSALFDRVLQMTGLLLFMRSLVDHLTDYAPRFGVRLDRRR